MKAKIQGKSMLPYLKPGQIIEIWPVTDTTKLKFGDIVVFKENDRLVCHILIRRVRNIQDNTIHFITQGLNVAHEDIPIASENIFAKAKSCPWYHLTLLLLKRAIRN